MPRYKTLVAGWGGNQSANERLRKAKGEFISQKAFDEIERKSKAPKYNLRRIWDDVMLEGEYTLEEALKKLGNGRMLSLYKMEPVKP